MLSYRLLVLVSFEYFGTFSFLLFYCQLSTYLKVNETVLLSSLHLLKGHSNLSDSLFFILKLVADHLM